MTRTVAQTRNRAIATVIAASALALAAVFAAAPAKADSDRHHRGHHGYAYGHHLPPGHAKKHGHYHGPVHHYGAPVYVYATPPVVYVSRPVHHHPPQPGITIVFPLNFD